MTEDTPTTDSADVEDRLDRLESLVEAQQETIQQQRERITELDGETDGDDTPLLANRRSALKAGGLLALLFGGVGTASADPQGQVGTSNDPLEALYTEELNGGVTGDTALTSLSGDGLTIDSGSLGIESGDVGTTELNTPFTDLSMLFGSPVTTGGNLQVDASNSITDASGNPNLTISDSGNLGVNRTLNLNGNTVTDSNGDLTLQGSSGNGLTFNTNGGDTTLELGVPSQDTDTGDTAGGNVVAGHPNNVVEGSVGAVIGGGGATGGRENAVDADFGTVGGGDQNTASGRQSTVGGGDDNTADGEEATVAGGNKNAANGRASTVAGGSDNIADDNNAAVGGGLLNTASGRQATVGGGNENAASSSFATIAGGSKNTASGLVSTVAGGGRNTTDGFFSFAAGQKAAAEDNYSFAWNDGTGYHGIPNTDTVGLSSSKSVDGNSAPPTGAKTFHASAKNGFRFITGGASSPNVTYIPGDSAGWTTTSTRSAKTNIDPVDPEAILDGVTEMEVATWEYKDDDGEGAGTRHVGPMAEDFHEVVDVGTSDDHINSINADGVALAAIQGLSKNLDETQADLEAKATRIADQQETIDDLESEVERKDDRIDALEAENEALRERVAAIEAELGLDATADRQGVADD